ncbi:MAG: pyridoxamine 5'-phosphate oxidase family protein [Bacteroidetes bacterium]|nr:pyridoxamine 5'-phosphate oxidase family protein [Bacteroidota bacterium]
MNYARFAFTDAIKALQENHGSRRAYEKVEKNNVVDGLSDNEIAFIQERDSFYMATYGENGYPYIQHRGGPAGFVKVIDRNTIGFVDFSGNKQYISVGNLATQSHTGLIMVSYPHRARLKLYANARVVGLEESPELFAELDPADYPHRPERMIILDIKAYDWNCPQHITPRYTMDEIRGAFEPQREYIKRLEEEVQALKEKLASLTH